MPTDADIARLRESILKRCEDLKNKITDNEKTPDKEQDYDMLSEIHDSLGQCLNNWYY